MPWSMRCAGAASRSSRRNSRLAEECNAEQLQAVSTALSAQIAEFSAHKGKKGLSALDLAETHNLVDHARRRALKSLQQRLVAQEQVQATVQHTSAGAVEDRPTLVSAAACEPREGGQASSLDAMD